jgi:RHS repeat-associated protein
MKTSWMKVFAIIVSLVLCAGISNASVTEYEEIIYYHNDALGSPIVATDINGDALWREQYSPYGSRLLYESQESDCSSGTCIPTESAWDEKQWFTGKLEESRSGIQYFGARWYEPEVGRFLSVDPVQFREDNIFSFNRYAYANNNPYKYTDPDGREVVQVGVSLSFPEVLGVFQKVLGRDIEVSGFGIGLAWSSPEAYGQGEYDIGLYLTTHLNSEGVDTGKVAFTYAESVDDSDTVKDLAGIGVGASVGFGLSGFNATYSEEGTGMVGFHIGPGVGATARGEATIVYSRKHGKLGWNSSSKVGNLNKGKKEKTTTK